MTKTLDEGVIKFNYNLKLSKPLESSEYIDLEKWRVIFFKMKLIGEYQKEKVGYGNLSKKINPQSDQFIITGTQTGKYPNLTGSQYTQILKCNLKKMSVEVKGPIAPSSETLTHHAIYSTSNQINAIFHIHDSILWKYMIKEEMEATSTNVSYGTEKMGEEALKCIANKNSGIFVMKGHQDGVIAYGSSCEQAGKIILEIFKKSRNQ
jgi:ribulose-5-phosphate 4-epimerase/fuculose-1-phosphate aldolase